MNFPTALDPHAVAEGKRLLAVLPDSDALKYVTLHWSVGTYTQTFPDAALTNGDNDGYHICVPERNGLFVAELTGDPRLNAIQVGDLAPYIGHCYHHNSFNVGIAACAMVGATAQNFGSCPITLHQIEVMCAAAAAVCIKYKIDTSSSDYPDLVFTHAEDASRNDYLGERWDLERLEGSPDQISASNAIATGNILRLRIHSYKITEPS